MSEVVEAGDEPQQREGAGWRAWRPTRFVVAVTALAVLLVAALGVGAYLYDTSTKWEVYSAAMTQKRDALALERDGLAGQLADVQRQLQDSQAANQDLTAQLQSASDRITGLSSEKAQVADQREQMTQLADRAAGVAVAMDGCARAMSDLLTIVLEDPDRTNYDQTMTAAQTSDAKCTQAQRLQAQLAAMLK